ncbi:hypothetical protein DENSPDRAFT_547625 [Dentipellis sp. KUC8613]|nr:hypothetical protein DENSPDRAFT_547625 [Dentipellis sp. KUC8613]
MMVRKIFPMTRLLAEGSLRSAVTALLFLSSVTGCWSGGRQHSSPPSPGIDRARNSAYPASTTQRLAPGPKTCALNVWNNITLQNRLLHDCGLQDKRHTAV